MLSNNKSTCPPPLNLSKENLAVWTAWNLKTDKEVAREAASKGSHINLCVEFLAVRQQCNLDAADQWFRKEILEWSSVLINRQQIYKAAHILQHISVNANVKFIEAFYTTTNQELRTYIGNYLLKNNALNSEMKQLWKFFDVIVNYEACYSKLTLDVNNIKNLDEQTSRKKSEIAVTIFMNTYDTRLVPFLHNEILWSHLLINSNYLQEALTWINVAYNSKYEANCNQHLLIQFKKSALTSEMINLPYSTLVQISTCTKECVLNELCSFGIFCDKEKSDLKLLLKRIKSSKLLNTNVWNVFTQHHSNLKNDLFVQMLIEYCTENEFFNILSECFPHLNISHFSANKYVQLFNDCHNIVRNFNRLSLGKHIYLLANILSGNRIQYLHENPILALTSLFVSNVSIENLGNIRRTFDSINNFKLDDILKIIFVRFPFLSDLFATLRDSNPISRITLYDLLKVHLNCDISNLFPFRVQSNFKFKSYLENQISTYKREIDYLFFLQQARPIYAYSQFVRRTDYDINVTIMNVYKLAFKNFTSDSIVASCSTFLDFLSVDKELFETKIELAKILIEANYNRDYISAILQRNERDPKILLHTVENCSAIVPVGNLSTGTELINALQRAQILVRYSELNSLRVSNVFLNYCAHNNLWLPFLIFSQMNNIPMEQVKLSVELVKSTNLLQHLAHALTNDIHYEQKHVLMRDRDSRNCYLSRIGVKKSVSDSGGSSTSRSSLSTLSISSIGSTGSMSTTNCSTDSIEIDVGNVKATLLQVLIKCHNSVDPPRALLQACQFYRNPLLAVLATTYEPDSIIPNWLNFLAVSCNLCEPFTNFEIIASSWYSVADLLSNCMRNKYSRTLYESFAVFLPCNPLTILTQILCAYLRTYHINYDEIQPKWETFQTALKSCIRNYVLSENDCEMTYLNSTIWIEKVALKLISALLDFNCNSRFEQILITDHMCRVNVKFLMDHNLCDLYNILCTLHEAECLIQFTVSEYLKDPAEAVSNCISTLMHDEAFDTALKIAQIAHLSLDLILINHCKHQFQRKPASIQNFWHLWNDKFHSYNVTANHVIDLYLQYSKQLESVEKYTVLRYATEWTVQCNLPYKNEVDSSMWLALIQIDNDLERRQQYSTCKLEVPALNIYANFCKKLESLTPITCFLTTELKCRVRELLHYFLDKENVWLALKIEKLFACSDINLEKLKLAYQLAEGSLSVVELNVEQRLWILSNDNKMYFPNSRTRRFLSSTRYSFNSSTSSCSFYTPSGKQDTSSGTLYENSKNDILSTLLILTDQLERGSKICEQIFLTYRISANIGVPYDVLVLTHNHKSLLKDVVEEDSTNKLQVIGDFFQVYKWSKLEIVNFIWEALLAAIDSSTLAHFHPLVMWDLLVDADFPQILNLMHDDYSMLGQKLLKHANCVTQMEEINDISVVLQRRDYFRAVELLIRAHECYAIDSNIEGISLTLKSSKEIIKSMLSYKYWQLIVRLFTGIRRYNEMNYVFEMLMNNEQFEYLLTKASKKDNLLKMALLEYLTRHYPDNRDLYKLVALHFILYSEVALLWDREAKGILRHLVQISKLEMQNRKLNPDVEPFILLENSYGTNHCLNKAMENYVHATEFHLQGQKLVNAMNSAKQAELIALQLSFLKQLGSSETATTTCLIDLKPEQIAKLISTEMSFPQVFILIEAYDYQPDWSTVLYEQYIIRNDKKFLRDFRQHFTLTDTILGEISQKFVSSKLCLDPQIKCMKNLISEFSLIDVKYRLASELGFKDLVEDLILKGDLNFLKDTVWKKGYKFND